MSELAFSKTILSLLDRYPSKLSPTHSYDAHLFPLNLPYTLPHYGCSKPMSPPSYRDAAPVVPGAAPNLDIHVHSLRAPKLDETLKDVAPETSMLEIKSRIASMLDVRTEAVRLLYKKKPVSSNTRTISEIVQADETQETAGKKSVVEFSVMVIGGTQEQNGQSSGSAEETLQTPEFWDDLKGFLMQRLKDATEADRLCQLFNETWERNRA